MTQRRSRPPSILLEPPAKGVELDDPGAQPSPVGSEDDHFSDASEGRRSPFRSRSPSPVPRTRVEKVDNSPSYGEIPGSPAYEKRELDAVPDEIEIIGNKSPSRPQSSASRRLSLAPDQIPRTVVEKIDPSSPSYGEEPGTPAYETHKADSAPDIILKIPESGSHSSIAAEEPMQNSGRASPVPETLLSRVESVPEDQPRPLSAHRRSPSDALPDAIQTVPDAPEGRLTEPGSPNSSSTRSEHRSHVRRKSTELTDDHGVAHQSTEDAIDDQQSGDDFDDFEEGDGDMGEDDFGDFDDAFQQPTEDVSQDTVQDIPKQPPPPSFPPLLDLDSIKNLPDLLTATSSQLDDLFPSSANLSTLPPIDPFPESSAIFITDRSLSLWSQLVAPPPLQPPNWIKSRIRRLFLVSLGVPVDLDEILPASKQKKLVLPSISQESKTTPNTTTGEPRNLTKLKRDGQQHARSSTSLDSNRSQSRNEPPRRRGPQPPPELDLSSVRRLCATTDAALNGFTDDELRRHISRLQEMTARASEVLEYWLKRRDAQLGEKEAFEGVIGNLVKHAQQVRK
ncbi:hypothetical protein FQN53_007513 [Emmonsiellopsis sp. PD_33]|nr:hypothetical protein FQN53_007513 [Emmonsiellopsis sp. PD_33]